MKCVLLIPTLAIAATAWAQVPTFSTNVNVVSLLATVHDHDSSIINNLSPNDFVLKQDGVRQKIRYFSRETDLPLTIGLLIDTSRSQQKVLERELSASKTFLDQVLREGKDQAFVIHFDVRVETLQGLTSSHKELVSALGQLSIPDEFATLLHSAIKESSEDFTERRPPGRKALILLTDGVAYKDPASLRDAIEAAQRADTIIYAIRFSGPLPIRGPVRTAILAAASEDGKRGLERMAKETGGAYYEVTKKQTIDAIYSQIEDALRSQYSIGYTPPRPPDGKYHKIKLTTIDLHLIVDTRDGYYAK